MREELNTGLGVFLGILTGMLIAFGLVLVYLFLGSDDAMCRSALYGILTL